MHSGVRGPRRGDRRRKCWAGGRRRRRRSGRFRVHRRYVSDLRWYRIPRVRGRRRHVDHGDGSAHAAGDVNVTVTTANASGTGTSAYTYLALPVIEAVTLDGGGLGGGITVTLSGSGLSGPSDVTFGGLASPSRSSDRRHNSHRGGPGSRRGRGGRHPHQPRRGGHCRRRLHLLRRPSAVLGGTVGWPSRWQHDRDPDRLRSGGYLSVDVGGVEGTDINVIDDATIEVTSPAHTIRRGRSGAHATSRHRDRGRRVHLCRGSGTTR